MMRCAQEVPDAGLSKEFGKLHAGLRFHRCSSMESRSSVPKSEFSCPVSLIWPAGSGRLGGARSTGPGGGPGPRVPDQVAGPGPGVPDEAVGPGPRVRDQVVGPGPGVPDEAVGPGVPDQAVGAGGPVHPATGWPGAPDNRVGNGSTGQRDRQPGCGLPGADPGRHPTGRVLGSTGFDRSPSLAAEPGAGATRLRSPLGQRQNCDPGAIHIRQPAE